MLPLVYIAGPYSIGDQAKNVRRAMICWHELQDSGLVAPVCPHLSHFLHLLSPRPHEEWLQHDEELLIRCDALFRLPGESLGSDAEVVVANNIPIPIFYDKSILLSWCDQWLKAHGMSIE